MSEAGTHPDAGSNGVDEIELRLLDEPPSANVDEEAQVDAELQELAASLEGSVRFEEALAWAHERMAEQGIGGGEESKAHRKPLFEPASALLSRQFAQLTWLVQGLVRPGSVVAVSAEPKSVKTWLSIEVCMAVSTGTKVAGEYRTGAALPTALFLVEDEERNTRARLCALARGRGLDPMAAVDQMYVQCRRSLDLLKDDDLAWLLASVHLLPVEPAVLMLDPFRDIMSAEENESGPMSEVMHRLRAVRDILGCTVLFVHHTGKQNRDNKAQRGGQRMRGSSAIHGAVDGGLYLSGLQTDGQSKWTNDVEVEVKAGRGAGKFKLTLEVEDKDDEAYRATWTFERADPNTVSRLTRDILETLRRAQGPLSTNQIDKAVSGNKAAITNELGNLELRGLVANKGKGHRHAWVYVEPTDEDDWNPGPGD